MSVVELRLDYDQQGSGLRRILNVEFPAGKVVTVAPKVAGFIVGKYGELDGIKVEVVKGKPETWERPQPPKRHAWDEVVRLPQVDPDREKSAKPAPRA